MGLHHLQPTKVYHCIIFPLVLKRTLAKVVIQGFSPQEFQDLWPRLAVVVDGGPIGDKSRLGSTVVDLSVLGKYRIIRPGW